MFDSVRPHRQQLTRLPRPWDSPGKNTGLGCHCLRQCMKVKSESEVAPSCPTLSDPMDCSPPGSSIHEIFQARVLEWGAIALGLRKCNVCYCPDSPLQGGREHFKANLMVSRAHVCRHAFVLSVSQSMLSTHHSQALFKGPGCCIEQGPHSTGAPILLPKTDSEAQ